MSDTNVLKRTWAFK